MKRTSIGIFSRSNMQPNALAPQAQVINPRITTIRPLPSRSATPFDENELNSIIEHAVMTKDIIIPPNQTMFAERKLSNRDLLAIYQALHSHGVLSDIRTLSFFGITFESGSDSVFPKEFISVHTLKMHLCKINDMKGLNQLGALTSVEISLVNIEGIDWSNFQNLARCSLGAVNFGQGDLVFHNPNLKELIIKETLPRSLSLEGALNIETLHLKSKTSSILMPLNLTKHLHLKWANIAYAVLWLPLCPQNAILYTTQASNACRISQFIHCHRLEGVKVEIKPNHVGDLLNNILHPIIILHHRVIRAKLNELIHECNLMDKKQNPANQRVAYVHDKLSATIDELCNVSPHKTLFDDYFKTLKEKYLSLSDDMDLLDEINRQLMLNHGVTFSKAIIELKKMFEAEDALILSSTEALRSMPTPNTNLAAPAPILHRQPSSQALHEHNQEAIEQPEDKRRKRSSTESSLRTKKPRV